MGEVSKIEWTDATFNPWIGCEKIAPECEHCYAEALAKRMKDGVTLWKGARRRTSPAYWRGPLKWARTLPAQLGRRPRVFCASLADVFDNQVPPDWRVDLFHLIRKTPELDWLLLTKRIGNAREMMMAQGGLLAPLPNVWLGVTAGTQKAFDRDVPKLLATPAAVHFVSAEPLLEELDISAFRYGGPAVGFGGYNCAGNYRMPTLLDWIIVGGESGAKARPFTLGHGKRIVRDARSTGIRVFVKQLGAVPVNREGERCPHITHRKGADMAEWPDELRVREFPQVLHQAA